LFTSGQIPLTADGTVVDGDIKAMKSRNTAPATVQASIVR
jgi:enamine deaminase RidA (YjgF/YER057c/UK114 family)